MSEVLSWSDDIDDDLLDIDNPEEVDEIAADDVSTLDTFAWRVDQYERQGRLGGEALEKARQYALIEDDNFERVQREEDGAYEVSQRRIENAPFRGTHRYGCESPDDYVITEDDFLG